MTLIRSSVAQPGLLTRILETKGGLYFPEYSIVVPKHCNVLAVVGRPDGRLVIPASNIVTNDGDLHYAQRGAAEAPTNFTTAIMEIATAGTPGKTAIRSSFTTVVASQKAIDGTYPKTNDGDADNTGAGTDIVTWLTSWTKADFNQTGITHGIVTNTAPAAGEVLLTGYVFGASFAKTVNDTLKVFVNHEMLGV